jgi:chromosome partitioning protein
MTPRILAVLGPKGGVGKSTIASNLLVAALLDGVAAAGLDLDSQGSLITWGQDRSRRGRQPAASVAAAVVGDWRAAVARERSRALVVVDCPPSLEDERRLAEVLALARAATLVLVPTLPHGASLRKVVDFSVVLRERVGAPVVFVLNGVLPNRTLVTSSRELLARRGELAPIEVPHRDAITRALDNGESVVETPGAPGSDALLALWRFAQQRLGLAEAA